MLHKQVQDADFVVFDFGELFDDGVGDEVGASRLGREREGLLEPRHVVVVVVNRRRRGRCRGLLKGSEGQLEDGEEEIGEEAEDEDGEEEDGGVDGRGEAVYLSLRHSMCLCARVHNLAAVMQYYIGFWRAGPLPHMDVILPLLDTCARLRARLPQDYALFIYIKQLSLCHMQLCSLRHERVFSVGSK